MSKLKTSFVCRECGYSTAKWLGKCPECNNWNSFEEEVVFKDTKKLNVINSTNKNPVSITSIQSKDEKRIQTKLSEFNRVVGGGLTEGSLTLIGGEPGIGKTTLLMEICNNVALQSSRKVLYISGEESESQIASRAERMKVKADNFLVVNENNWNYIKNIILEIKPILVVIDSIQTTINPDLGSASGTMSQIRDVTFELMNLVKSNNITAMLIGHVTKEGGIAGPKILEHMVDTVLYFEGDNLGVNRFLRVIKNRYGNTNEVGIFSMEESGLKEVNDPSEFFVDKSIKDASGRSITCTLEGTRPLFVEIQALVVPNKFGNGRRTTQGIDVNRLSLLVAILEKYYEIPLSFNDIYLNIVGGLKLVGRESDLSVLVSILSSYFNQPIASDLVFVGEVGLTGEVRSGAMIESKIKECSQQNYKKIVTNLKNKQIEISKKYKIEIINIHNAKELKKLLFQN
jgi:DNA repair protein RadA/Sms